MDGHPARTYENSIRRSDKRRKCTEVGSIAKECDRKYCCNETEGLDSTPGSGKCPRFKKTAVDLVMSPSHIKHTKTLPVICGGLRRCRQVTIRLYKNFEGLIWAKVSSILVYFYSWYAIQATHWLSSRKC